MNATGVYIRSRSVPRVLVPSCTLLDVSVYMPAWVFRICSFVCKVSQDLRGERADEDTPFFVCGSKRITNDSDAWVSVGVTW